MSTLAIIVAIAVIGQLCLPLVGAYRNARANARAKQRARLLEAAADRQSGETDKIKAIIAHHRDSGVSE
jgi:hypothetical protein